MCLKPVCKTFTIVKRVDKLYDAGIVGVK